MLELQLNSSTKVEDYSVRPFFAKPHVGSSALQLSNIQVNEEYCKKWNERMTDFVVLTKDGELVSNSLYRVGGMGGKPDGKNYFLLLIIC